MAELTHTQAATKIYVRELLNRKSLLEVEKVELQNAISFAQKNCKHSFSLIGHNHNDDIEECEICGYRRTV